MPDDGCTAIVALLTEDNHLYVANAGDSRCVICKNGKAQAMSSDHKPGIPEEVARIESTGHSVHKETIIVNGTRTYAYRVDGQIAVSRAIGDADYKDNYGESPEKQAITCVPDITEEDLAAGDFIILACDGVWDVLSNEDVVNFINQRKQSQDIQTITEQLVEEAIQKGSQDNITVVIVCIV